MLAARDLTVVRGAQVVLEGVDLVVDGTSRIGVLGRNGAGKSTLLRCLAGLEAPSSGTIERSPPTLSVGYLAQEPDPLGAETTAAYLRRRTGLATAEQVMQAALRAVGDHPGPAELEAYDDALARFLALGGDDHDSRRLRVLADVGLDPAVLARPLVRLSGGQRVKAGLAAILLARFDVLLLDEPTNNLDFDGLARLERFLAGEARPVVLVSHDRAFLSATTTRIAELDLHSHRLSEYGGGYDAFLEERRRRREQAASRRGERRTDNDKALAGRRKERATAGATRAKAIERRLERLGDPEKPWEGWDLRLSLQAGRRRGEVVGHLGQDRTSGEGTLLEAVRERTELSVEEARSLLAKFDLGPEHLARAEADLSPGERSRAGLAVLVAKGTNLLLLDEPTNHLDLDAIEELEGALAGYDGTLVVVSHDRRLLANLRLGRRLEVVDGRVTEAPLPVATPG